MGVIRVNPQTNMTSVEDHYRNLLARHYTWMRGDYDSKVREYRGLFRRARLSSKPNSTAIDLGAGSGFQSVALADLGFDVVSVDLSGHLLEELHNRIGNRRIRTVLGDIRDPGLYEAHAPIGVAVCMGDTLTHLESYDEVATLLVNTHAALREGGELVLEFRDLATELQGVDRAIPVRLDEDRIMTTFLEYEPGRVNVHDMVFNKEASGWVVEKSAYSKLRLGPDVVLYLLHQSGFEITKRYNERGFSVIVARSQAAA